MLPDTNTSNQPKLLRPEKDHCQTQSKEEYREKDYVLDLYQQQDQSFIYILLPRDPKNNVPGHATHGHLI